ncbi:hypothetical protein [Treponema sp. R6D11]
MPYKDGLGRSFETEDEAANSNMNTYGDKSGPGGGAGGMLAGGFAAIIVLGPVIAAKLVGLIWGLLLKLPTIGKVNIGKIITTALMVIAGPIIFLIPIAFLPKEVHQNMGGFFSLLILLGSGILTPTWYFLWHYDVVKEMGALEFSGKIKTAAMFLWFGYIGAAIIGFIKSPAAQSVVSICAVIAGFGYYFIATRPYARAVAERNKGNAKTALKSIVMLVAVGFVVLLTVGKEIEKRNYEAKEEAATAAIIKPITDTVKKASTQDVFVTVIKNRFTERQENTRVDGTYYLQEIGTNIHSQPSTGGTKVKTPKIGDRLKVTGDVIIDGSEAWLPVEFQGVRGFIEAIYRHEPFVELATGGQTVQSTIPEISIPEETTSEETTTDETTPEE